MIDRDRAAVLDDFVCAAGQGLDPSGPEELLTGAGEGLEHCMALRAHLNYHRGLLARTLIRCEVEGRTPDQRVLRGLPREVVEAVRGLLGVSS